MINYLRLYAVLIVRPGAAANIAAHRDNQEVIDPTPSSI